MVASRERLPEPPQGWERLRWWGPGLLWMVSAVGSGSVLFTPRVGSEYGYGLLWLLLLVSVLMFAMVREAARFTVVTGRTILDGLSTLRGPANWAVWVVFLPQLLAASVGIAGLSGLVGSALQSELAGGLRTWSLVVLACSTALVVGGGFRQVSRVSQFLALAMLAIILVAAASQFPGPAAVGSGLLPAVPDNLDVPFVLPWVGTILAGSMGILWFSYWTARRGFGGGLAGTRSGRGGQVVALPAVRLRWLHQWLSVLTQTAVLGVAAGTVVICGFLILGAELLGPRDIVPSGTDVARQLTGLLETVWGSFGYWAMLAAILVALGGSVIANQDGWGRSFADITLILGCRGRSPAGDESARQMAPGWLQRLARLGLAADYRRAIKNLYVVVITGLVPAVLIVTIGDPVVIMSASGIVAAVHTPFIAFMIHLLNRRLPPELRPGRAASWTVVAAAVFYLGFGSLYLAELLGWLPGPAASG